MSTVVADGAVTEKVTTGARELVIVNGGHNRKRRVPGCVQDSRAEQGEGVVHVHDVGPMRAQQRSQAAVSLAAPDDPGRQRHLLRPGPILNLVAAGLESHDLVPACRARLAFGVNDAVLAAGCGPTV